MQNRILHHLGAFISLGLFAAALTLGKGYEYVPFTSAKIRYFDTADSDEACAWIREEQPSPCQMWSQRKTWETTSYAWPRMSPLVSRLHSPFILQFFVSFDGYS